MTKQMTYAQFLMHLENVVGTQGRSSGYSYADAKHGTWVVMLTANQEESDIKDSYLMDELCDPYNRSELDSGGRGARSSSLT